MVYIMHPNDSGTFVPFDTRLFEDKRYCLVYPSDCMPWNRFYLRTPGVPPLLPVYVSIVICTYDRQESLNDTLESLTKQTYKDFEVILLTEKGHLSELRQRGLECAVGSIVSFIDDDVYCPPTWLEGVVKSFREGVVGVSGPTIIVPEYQKNRDCLKYEKLRKLQEWIFKVSLEPGRLSPCGAPSMASNFKGCRYEGEVDYLECCNMSVRRSDAIDAKGFDTAYYRTSEWSEVELSLKLKRYGVLHFSLDAMLFHRPSKSGVYQHRLSTAHRWENFKRFQKRWIKPSFRRHLYWIFIWTYYKLKEMRMI